MRSKVRKESPLPAEARRLRPENRMPAPFNTQSVRLPHRISLSGTAYERLLGMLRSRELQPNDLINERQLARQLNVSRTPLREAIPRLEGEKILERQSSGTLVVRPVSIEDLLYICQVRRLVEGEAARRAAGRIAASELEQLRRHYMSFKEKGGPIPATAPIVRRDLHLLIAEACGNPILASIIRELKNRSQLLSVSTPERVAYDEHLEIIDALMKGDGDAARAAMQRHIDSIRTYELEKLGAL